MIRAKRNDRGEIVLSSSTVYPVKWSRVVTTRDNVTYRIRPICAQDASREREFIMGLTRDSRYTRMLHTIGEPPPELVERFVQVDYRHNMAFVAVVDLGDDERIIGVARYAENGRDDHEFAVVVTDEWHGRGIAATLSCLLFDYARAQGIRALHAIILTSNYRMIELARRLGMTIRSTPEDPTVIRATADL